MKWLVGIVAVLTILIVTAAFLRVATSSQDTEPFVKASDLTRLGSKSSPDSQQEAFGKTGTGGAVVEHLRGGRLDEIEQTGGIATGNPQSNTDYNASKAVERASSIEDGRQGDLDDAKKKIGKIGK